ncbi:MAG: hypothetical protein AB7O64_17800 [Methylibium sp.]
MSVTPFPVQPAPRQTFSGVDVPANQPAIFRASPEAVSAAAMALAHANGETWASMTPTLMDSYRQAVVTGALLVDPAGRQLIAYLLEAHDPDVALMPSVTRRTRVAGLASRIACAMRALWGLDPDTLKIAGLRQHFDDVDRVATKARW